VGKDLRKISSIYSLWRDGLGTTQEANYFSRKQIEEIPIKCVDIEGDYVER
jgi:hypothetical protein